jgi:SAM-dependent methyltransferase
LEKITSTTVQDSFNESTVALHYARAAHQLGLWASERLLIERWLPDRAAPLLDVGCGAGRVAFGLWDLGYRNLTAVDFAGELLDHARRLASLRAVTSIRFLQADATQLTQCNVLRDKGASAGDGVNARCDPEQPETRCNVLRDKPSGEATASATDAGGASGGLREEEGFAGALFMFNGLMQIPGRDDRRQALREIRAVCRPDACFLFTTHDRDDDSRRQPLWAAEAGRWARGEEDPRLIEFGDRYFANEHGGHTFMHLPTRTEVLEDLAATGWTPLFDEMRRAIAPESAAVREFADECRFWVACAGHENA